MKFISLLLLLLFISTSSFAQKFTLEGIVKNQDLTALEGATVFVQSIKDSIVLSYDITNKNGEFSFNVNADDNQNNISFNISFLGYKPYSKDIVVPKGKELNLGSLNLEEIVEELGTVSIVARTPPIKIKQDTLEYNAGSFKTLPNDKAEDLLRKLPGVEIDVDGKITVNGIEVQAINIDGQRFFGENLGDIALKNLPSDIISKVQVTDYKTNMQKFTGEESDSGTKEINFSIKKGKNNSTFGEFNGGIGTENKYQANANLFKLIDGKQIGVIAGANNINMSKGFNSLPDTDTSNGYIESDFLGANFSKGKWNETRINSNYRYSSQNKDTEQTAYRENFLPDLNYITNTQSKGNSESDRHQANLDLKFILPSKSKLSKNKTELSNEINFNNSNGNSFNSISTLSQYNNGDLVSDYTSTSGSSSSNYDLENNFKVTSRVGKNHDYFNIGLGTHFDKSNSDGEKKSKNVLYQNDTTIIQDQESNSDNSGSNINFNAVLNKNVTPNFRIIPSYNANVNYKKNENKVYDYNETNADYNDFNRALSSDSKYIATSIKPALRLRYQFNDFRFEVEGAFTNTYRKYDDELIEERNFKTEFQYFTYSGRVRYRDKSGNKRIDLRYNQNVNLPSMNQLQPVADVSDITHVRVGNPLLKPSVSHDLSFGFRRNFASNNINISGDADAEFVQDKIINSTVTDDDLIKYTTYTNINGDYTLSGRTAISKSFYNKETNFNINLRLNGSYRNSISVQNGIKFILQNTTLRPAISFKYAYDKKLDFSASYSYSLSKNVYDTDIYNDNKYFVQNLRFDTSVFFLKNAFFTNKIAYSYNSRVGDAFDGDAIFWNAGLGVQLWENKGTLSLVGYDILGKNNGFRRSVSETYIQDVENKILERYFMLTFEYKFGRFPTQNMNNRGIRRRS